MTTIKTDFVGRVRRLPEPRNAAEALQPLFEAVMNAVHSTQDKFKDTVSEHGRVDITVTKKDDKKSLSIVVADNGNGLNSENYDAFLTTDTEHKKITRGGKGVGRLLWLACFEDIHIKSDFIDNNKKQRRSFKFSLKETDQIEGDTLEDLGDPDGQTGFIASFSKLKNGGYEDKFPQRAAYLFQHLLSHFLPVMIGNKCPQISVSYNDESRVFPRDIADYIKRKETVDIVYDGQPLKMEMLECDKVVSSNLQGSNFVHFIAHDRTVHSQPIDGKLGLKAFGQDGHVFQALLTGDFLDKHVNQERTQFTFETNVIEKIISETCIPEIEKFLVDPLKTVKESQVKELSKIVGHYPSVAFGSMEELLDSVPAGETRDEQLYGHLSIIRYRRDSKQRDKINLAIGKLKNNPTDFNNFEDALKEASSAILDSEQKSLAEYVVRRKVVLNFLTELLKAIKKKENDSDYQLEATLHNFICPIRMKSSGLEATSHDLWVIDERLTFSRTFSSDLPFQEILEASENESRPDLLVFDNAFGLRHGKDSPHVLIVEFKRPGRQSYKDDENPQFQVERYIRELRSPDAVDLGGRPIRLPENVRFHCFIIADRRGKIADWTASWPTTADGRGRIYTLQGDYSGFIELIEWDQLLNDAEDRNKAFFDQLGINQEEAS